MCELGPYGGAPNGRVVQHAASTRDDLCRHSGDVGVDEKHPKKKSPPKGRPVIYERNVHENLVFNNNNQKKKKNTYIHTPYAE